MKFDMSKAWDGATEMLAANREVVWIVAGVFFFLPGFASALLMTEPPLPSGGDEAAMQAALTAFFVENAPNLLIASLIQLIGSLTLLALLRDTSKPTVGEALKIGAIGLIPYIGVGLILAVGATLLILVATAIPAALGLPLLAAALMLLLVPVIFYVSIKLLLITPVIAIEKMMNPIAIMQRSWRLTKGNSLRLFLFYVLLLVAYGVISLVVSNIAALLLALLGDGTAADIGNGLIAGLVGMAGGVVFTVVLASIHRQLAGQSAGNIGQTFG